MAIVSGTSVKGIPSVFFLIQPPVGGGAYIDMPNEFVTQRRRYGVCAWEQLVDGQPITGRFYQFEAKTMWVPRIAFQRTVGPPAVNLVIYWNFDGIDYTILY